MAAIRPCRPASRAALFILLLHLPSSTGQISSGIVCDYPVDSIIRFAASDGTSVERAGTNYPITTTSLNVGFGTSGIAEIDIANPTCQFGNCPVILKGFNFDKLLPSGDSTIADVFCWFGDGLPCSSVPINIRLDELSCASPTLPADPTIVPFGVLVLGADTTPPGTLYVPEGLEMTFFDTERPPIIHRLEPLASDTVDVPTRIRVVGANFGPGRQGVPQPIQCRWKDEVPLNNLVSQGFYYPEEQTTGDQESFLDCPGPVGVYSPGDYAYLRVALAGGDSGYEAVPPGVDLYSEGQGSPLVFFDARRKPQLYGHHSTSETYGDVSGGSVIVLEGDNFAPLYDDFGEPGIGLSCVFETPGRIYRNASSNMSALFATFISPTRIACLSPNYHLRLGETPIYVNTTYNTSLFEGGSDVAQSVDFVYYDQRVPPQVRAVVPPYAPIHGRPIRFAGGEGWWYHIV